MRRDNYLEYFMILSILFIAAISSTDYAMSVGSGDAQSITGAIVNLDKEAQYIDLSCNDDLNELKNSSSVCDNRLTICQNRYTEVYSNYTSLTGEFDSLSTKFSMTVDGLKAYIEKYDGLQLKSEQCFTNLAGLINDFNSTIKNAANNICCKNRFDDPSINSYYLSNSQIVCSSNSTQLILCSI